MSKPSRRAGLLSVIVAAGVSAMADEGYIPITVIMLTGESPLMRAISFAQMRMAIAE